MILCKDCLVNKPYTEFYKRGEGKYHPYCKPCHRHRNNTWVKNNRARKDQTNAEWLAKNRDRKIKTNKEWRLRNLERHKLNDKLWSAANRGRKNEARRRWVKNNPHKSAALSGVRRRSRKQSMPKWLTRQHKADIAEWYLIAKELQWLSDERLEVDHIVPIRGVNVCGLHVPWNLQILPGSQNASKGNKFK